MVAVNSSALPTSKGHQWLALIGAAFVLFEIVFIGFYSNNFWFSLNLVWWGLPAVAGALVAGHLLLMFAESDRGCRVVSAVWRGKPPLTYRRWLRIDDDGFRFGTRHVQWQVVDEVGLTWLGNLEIKSRAICGNSQSKPDVIFKFPFAVAAQEQQRVFLDRLKQARPDVVLNARLTKRVESQIVRGQNLIQAFCGAIMFVLLLDLGFSSFYYLEMLKHYYLAEVAALSGDSVTAGKELAEGDQRFEHPFPFSYITSRFLNTSSCAADIAEIRSDALWYSNRKDEALAQAKRAVELTPQTSRARFHYVRLLEETGKRAEAREQIAELVDRHKDWLLPRLYMLANIRDTKPSAVPASYEWSMKQLNDALFGNEPAWPPGGESFTHDLFFSDDIYFVFNRLLQANAKRPPLSK